LGQIGADALGKNARGHDRWDEKAERDALLSQQAKMVEVQEQERKRYTLQPFAKRMSRGEIRNIFALCLGRRAGGVGQTASALVLDASRDVSTDRPVGSLSLPTGIIKCPAL
jgi:hypothetical protein